MAYDKTDDLELTIRVVDSRKLRSDQVLGETRVHLSSDAEGAGCLQLLGGGLATLCLRWRVSEGDTPGGDDNLSDAGQLEKSHRELASGAACAPELRVTEGFAVDVAGSNSEAAERTNARARLSGYSASASTDDMEGATDSGVTAGGAVGQRPKSCAEATATEAEDAAGLHISPHNTRPIIVETDSSSCLCADDAHVAAPAADDDRSKEGSAGAAGLHPAATITDCVSPSMDIGAKNTDGVAIESAAPAEVAPMLHARGDAAEFLDARASAPVDEPQAASSALPLGSHAFEEALEFWEVHLASSLAFVAGILTSRIRDASSEEAGELLLQAPLTNLFIAAADAMQAAVAERLEGAAGLLPSLASALPRLSVLVRARLAAALSERLSRCGSGPRPALEEQLLHDIFRVTSGHALIELKRLLDTAGCGVDLVRISHVAVTRENLQKSLVAHFWEEAGNNGERPLHVLSDVDMTFWTGRFGAGGPKFPQGPIPGSRQLLRALGGQVTFLSARPQLVEAHTRRDLLDAGVAEAGLLAGSVWAVLQCAVRGKEGRAAVAERKARAFSSFARLHPEARLVFIGDSGEGDVDFALETFVDSQGACAALIHDVVDELGATPCTPAPRRDALREVGVLVFDTYAGAALELHHLGLLPVEALQEAAQSCHDEFVAISPSGFASEAVYVNRYQELLADLDDVDAILSEAGQPSTRRRLPDLSTPWWRL